MADEDDAGDLGGDGMGDVSTGKKKGGKIGAGFLKFVLIGVAAVILIVTIVVITVMIMGKNQTSQQVIPTTEISSTVKAEYSWYDSLPQISTLTSDDIPATVRVTIALGYKKDDKNASTEITSRRIEIQDHLRRFFSMQTIDDLKPNREEELRINIRNGLNDEILSNARILDVRFTQKDVTVQQ